MNNFTIIVLSISIALQLTAAVFALRLNRKIRGAGHAWLLIATALMLMATRRIVTFVGFFAPEVEATVKGPVAESIALLIAFLMLAGVLLIPRVFHSLQQTAAALRASEARYRALVDSAEDVIFSLDSDGRYMTINASALRRLGWTEADFVGKTVRDFHPPQEAAFYEAQHARVFETGQPAHFERHSANELGEFWFSTSLSPIFDPAGKVVAISGISRDITERVRAAAELRSAHQLLETIFDHTHMMVAYLDSQFNFIRVNRAYALADEREPEFYPGKNHFDLFPYEENEAIFQRVVKTGEPHFEFARPFEYAEHPERGVSHWDWNLVPIKDENGKVKGLVLTLLNVTERIQAEEALRRRADELNILYDVAIAAATAVHLDEILNRVMDGLQKTLKPDAIAILLSEPESNELVIRASRGFPGGPKLVRRAIGEGIPGWVVETGQAALVADVRGDPRYHACDDDTRSELCVPFRVGERTTGALNIESREVAAFGERDLRLLSTLAGHLGVIIENARLYQDVQHYAGELERRVQERTAELQKFVNLMAGREVRMADLKDVIRQLRAQLQDAGLTPATNDPLAQ